MVENCRLRAKKRDAVLGVSLGFQYSKLSVIEVLKATGYQHQTENLFPAIELRSDKGNRVRRSIRVDC